MGQSTSSTNYSGSRDVTPATTSDHVSDYDRTDELPDECLAYVFHFLGQGDRKSCSLVSRRWLRLEGQSRSRLSLNAQSEIGKCLPSIFSRFDSVSKLSLRCTRSYTSLNDDALILVALRCRNLTRLKLRGCREITDLGISEFAKHCSDKLKKLSFGSCVFGAHGMNAVLNHCKNLEEISIKRLRGILEGADKIGPGAAASSLKSICLKELVNGQCFEPMVMGAKNLETLKVIRCLGDWDGVVGAVGRENHGCLIEVHLEKIRVSDLGLLGISKCVNLETLHIVKAPECSNSGLVTVAQNCRKLRKLHVDGWGTHRIGDEGLIAVANNCGNLQELVLIGVHATQFSLTAIAANCLTLERLALCGSAHIGDAEIACVANKCLALKKLCIKGCSISDTAIEALSWGCPNLVKVKVKKCRGVSNEVVDWLQERKGGLVVNFDACETEGLDASSSDVGGQEIGVEFPGMGGGQLVAAGAPSGGAAGRARLALAWGKLGVFAGRNLVTCAFNRWSNNEG